MATSQLPLDLTGAPGLSRDDLVVSPANASAVALIDRWPDWPAPVVVLAGPAGSGKTHLATVWRQRSNAISIDATTLGPATIPLVNNRPVLIDRADEAADDTAFFHILNAARAASTQVLLTARRFPAAWGVALPDLASRLRSATLVEIGEPDDHLLSAVMTKLFADRQVQVEPHVIAYLATRIERSLSTAMQVVDRIDHAALSRKVRISRGLAAEIVTALDAGQGQLDL